jgi:diacylglycerol kinase (ATP)
VPAARYRILHNANAGSKAGIPLQRDSSERLRQALGRYGLAGEIVSTENEPEAITAVHQAVDAGIEVVVAAGGDGTVGTIANELLGTGTCLGILPLGSVMNIARSLGIPRDLDEAVAALMQGRATDVDVGETGGQRFFEGASIGLNAAILREADHFGHPGWRSIARSIWVAIRYRPARMELRLDDRIVRTRALLVAIANGPYTGAGMTVAPDARLDDGRFDVRVFRGFSKWELFRHLASIAFGRRRYAPHVSTYRSTRVRVTSARPLPARADRRDLGTTPLELEVRPAALRVIVPGPVVGQVARPAVRHADVAIDRERLVVGLPRAGLVRIGQPGGHDRGAADHGFAEGIERVAHVGAEEVADGGRIAEPPGIDVPIEPGLERGVVHGASSSKRVRSR